MPRDRPSKITFLDLETAGLELTRPIIQIAAITVDDDLIEQETFEVKLQFDPNQADPESLRKNHYCPNRWSADAVAPIEAARQFASFLRRHASVEMFSSRQQKPYRVARLAAHNAERFDGPFLQSWYESLGLFLPAAYAVMCTKQRAHWLFQEHPSLPAPRSFQLRTLCQYFGVPLSAESAHDALNDVRALVEVYRRIVALEQQMRQASAACKLHRMLTAGRAP